VGNEFIPVAYIGTQAVAGTNDMILCRSTAVVPNAQTKYQTVVVYQGLDGSVEISDIKDFEIADYTDGKGSAGTAKAGGWTVPDDYCGVALPSDVESVFEAAVSTMTGNNLDPIYYLGSQQVEGTLFAVLCYSEPDDAIQVVTIYQDLNGNSTIDNICTVDLSKLS